MFYRPKIDYDELPALAEAIGLGLDSRKLSDADYLIASSWYDILHERIAVNNAKKAASRFNLDE